MDEFEEGGHEERVTEGADKGAREARLVHLAGLRHRRHVLVALAVHLVHRHSAVCALLLGGLLLFRSAKQQQAVSQRVPKMVLENKEKLALCLLKWSGI